MMPGHFSSFEPGAGVGAALSSACGLAVTSFFPSVPLPVGAAIHAVAAAALVGFNRYARFQRVMKALIGTMAISVLVCAVLVTPSLGGILRGFFVPTIPPSGGGAQVLSLPAPGVSRRPEPGQGLMLLGDVFRQVAQVTQVAQGAVAATPDKRRAAP